MAWTKREAVSNLAILGDDPENNVTKIAGLLLGIEQDRMYPEKQNYRIGQKDGDVLLLSGSASLGRQISERDVGKFLKCEFTGWGRSANGRFKMIEVNIWDGEPTDAMKAWPGYGTVSPSPHEERKALKPIERGAHHDDDFDPHSLEDGNDDLDF